MKKICRSLQPKQYISKLHERQFLCISNHFSIAFYNESYKIILYCWENKKLPSKILCKDIFN